MKRWLLVLVLLGVGIGGLTARQCHSVSGTFGARHQPEPEAAPLPAFDGATAWLNTSEAITPEQLRGNVTLVVFWAYSNARVLRVLPVLKQWYTRYRDQGLEIIGVHTPEFPFERSVGHVQMAVEQLGMTFPVAVDSERRLWTAYRNHEWPAYYVADPHGQLLGFQVGAGREAEVEQYLRDLLTERGTPPVGVPVLPVDLPADVRVPERVFRQPLGDWFRSAEPPVSDEPRPYTVPEPLPLYGVALGGLWQVEEERVRVMGASGRLVVQFAGPRCGLVLEGEPTSVLEVRLDGRPVPSEWAGADLLLVEDRSMVRLDIPRSYELISVLASSESHRLEVIMPRGVSAYACTF